MDEKVVVLGAHADNGTSEMSGFTAPAASPGQAESRDGKRGLDAWLAGRGDDEQPEWLSLYDDLLAERVLTPGGHRRPRWDWRKALYIAWSALPKSKRKPASERELATLLNLDSDRSIRRWRANDPEIDRRIAEAPKRLLMGHVADVLDALIVVASTASPQSHQDRKLFLEMTRQYQPKVAPLPPADPAAEWWEATEQ